MIACYCGSGKEYAGCCEPCHLGKEKAPTAKALMRSRYAAYCVGQIDYLLATTHISTRKHHSRQETRAFASQNQWIRLEILDASENIVEFKAHYLDSSGTAQVHHEKSAFKKEAGNWYYVDGEWY
jgi:SEC-C motif domain protein